MEVVLRTTTPYPISKRGWISHPEFLYTNDPALSGIDASGFRELDGAFKVPAEGSAQGIELAAIGDSFTYGYNVSARQS